MAGTLTPEQRHLREQMEVVSFRFLHAETYFRATTGHESTFRAFSQNCFGEVASLLWCHIFNSWNNDPVHYRNLFGEDKLAPLAAKFSTATVQQRLLNAASLDEAGYTAYRKVVTDFRNEYVAHREYERGSITFPDLKIASAMVQELRNILHETVVEELKAAPKDPDLIELNNYFQWNRSADVIATCEKDAAAEMRK